LSTAEKLARLSELRRDALQGGGPARVEQQHGKLTARERLDSLLDDGTFEELDAFVTHRATDFGLDDERYLGDGVVTGHGLIDGRAVFVYAQDFTVFGGSLSEAHAEKICKVMDLAMQTGAPIIGLSDSGGARIQEGVASLGGYAEIFLRNTLASGVVPQISLILGPCAGGAVYSPAITDFTIMAEGTSYMFVTGPNVVKTVTHEEVDFDGLGGARVHNERSGVAQFMAAGEPQAIALARTLLGYLPQNNVELTPLNDEWKDPDVSGAELEALIPICAQHHLRVRADRGQKRRHRRAAAGGVGRRARHRRIRQGRALRPHLRLLQRAPHHVGRRAGFPAGRRPGASRHHSSRREIAVRLLRSDRPQADGHHPQGVRRGVRRHEQQACSRRPEFRLADGGDRSDGRRGRGEHHLSGRHRGRQGSRNGARTTGRRIRGAVREPICRRGAWICRRGLRVLEGKRQALPAKKHGNIPL